MNNLVNFFNLLFGIEVAVFGIISAVILVFIQLLYSNFSYKHISQILKNISLVFFFTLSAIDLLLTAFGSFFLSLEKHDFVPEINFQTGKILSNPYYALICLILIFFSIAFFVYFIATNISYLQPHRAIFLLFKNIKFGNIRDFLWHEYDLKIPYSFEIRIATNTEANHEQNNQSVKIEKKETDDIEKLEEQITSIKQKTRNSEDPLLPIWDMAIQLIKRSDLSSLKEVNGVLNSISKEFISRLPREKDRSKWIPEGVLIDNYSRYFIDHIATLIEITENEGFGAGKQIILENSYNYSKLLVENGYYQQGNIIVGFWKKKLDTSIGESRSIFIQIIGYYRRICEDLFELKKKEGSGAENSGLNRLLEDIFRDIGWIGERLLIRQPIEESPIMICNSFSTEYDEIYNFLLSFIDKYDNDFPDDYPLIFFDALYVVLKRLIEKEKEQDTPHVSENIYSLAYAFASFAENAIGVNNSDGAGLAAMKIKQAYEDIKNAELNKLANDVIQLLIRIGILASGNKGKMKKVDFLDKDIDEWVIDTLVESGENIEKAVLDSYLHSRGGNYEDKWSFITRLGMRLGSNFGLMFDPKTGERYADDDPRRR